MAEKYFIGPRFLGELRDTVYRVQGMPLAGGGAGSQSLVHGLQFWDASGGGEVRLGKTTATWSKGTLSAIDLYESGTPPNETSSGTLENCVNKFIDISSGRWVMVAQAANGSYYVIAAEC